MKFCNIIYKADKASITLNVLVKNIISDMAINMKFICRCFGSRANYLTRTNTRYTKKNGAVSEVNKKFISHLTRTQLTPPTAVNVQASHALPAVRFSCLL